MESYKHGEFRGLTIALALQSSSSGSTIWAGLTEGPSMKRETKGGNGSTMPTRNPGSETMLGTTTLLSETDGMPGENEASAGRTMESSPTIGMPGENDANPGGGMEKSSATIRSTMTAEGAMPRGATRSGDMQGGGGLIRPGNAWHRSRAS
jgi:hypothetical protein